jgi:hypothetical protein
LSNHLVVSFALVVVMVFWTAYRLRANRRLFIQTTLLGLGLLAFGGVVALVWSRLPTINLAAITVPGGGGIEGKFAKDAGSEDYKLDGKTVTLTNGVFQEPYSAWLNRPRNPYDNAKAKATYLSPEPMTAGKVATLRLTDKRVVGDVSSDGAPDEAVVFTFTADGDATYYFVTLRRTTGEWHGATTNSIQLGDRIAVEAVRIEGGKLFVDTLDRRRGEPITAVPSVRVTRVFESYAGGLEESK